MINDNLNLYDNHHNLYTTDDIKMLENFNNLSSMPIIQVSNENFKNGTFRIIKSGIYKLTENIIFSPNSNIYTSLNCHDLLNVLDNFHPTESQKSDYPTPPYQFGFFAAITIECDNVILECKFLVCDKEEANRVIRSSPFRPWKNSKYVIGVKMTNYF